MEGRYLYEDPIFFSPTDSNRYISLLFHLFSERGRYNVVNVDKEVNHQPFDFVLHTFSM